jgi:hypothetical protein
LTGRDQMIGEEEPERLFLAFEFRQAHMLQMNLREALVALRPKFRRIPQFGEHGGSIERRREGGREQRQNATLAGTIERCRIAAVAPHRNDKGPGAEHKASLGEGQGPARRALLVERQKRMFKTVDGARANLPCDRREEALRAASPKRGAIENCPR